MTVSEIRESLLDPDARIAPGYQMVSVLLGTKSFGGFARNRSNFDIQLQTFDGALHLFHAGDFTEIREEKHSPMPAAHLAPEVERDLIAYLGNLTGVHSGETIPKPERPTGRPQLL